MCINATTGHRQLEKKNLQDHLCSKHTLLAIDYYSTAAHCDQGSTRKPNGEAAIVPSGFGDRSVW